MFQFPVIRYYNFISKEPLKINKRVMNGRMKLPI